MTVPVENIWVPVGAPHLCRHTFPCRSFAVRLWDVDPTAEQVVVEIALIPPSHPVINQYVASWAPWHGSSLGFIVPRYAPTLRSHRPIHGFVSPGRPVRPSK